MNFKRFVSTVQVTALILLAVTISMLFRSGPAPVLSADGTVHLGQATFIANCARCHGADGTGAVGPDLTSGNVFTRFEVRTDMLEFVATGRNIMPAFAEQLSPGEIGAVVDFVRSELAQ